MFMLQEWLILCYMQYPPPPLKLKRSSAVKYNYQFLEKKKYLFNEIAKGHYHNVSSHSLY